MIYHVLNGDALVQRFVATGLQGEIAVARECLIEGDLTGDTPDAFYQSRARYLATAYVEDTKNYFAEVASEFEKLRQAPNGSEFNLWFGYDLFCSANMWFILSLLHHLPITKAVYLVYPSYLQEEDIWKDFGGASPENLIACFNNRIPLSAKDISFGNALWTAFKTNNFTQLKNLSQQHVPCFPYLEEVCRAHIEQFATDGKGRPEKAVAQIIKDTSADFPLVFAEFFKREGVYGFGDTQLKKIYDKVMQWQ